MSNEKFYEAVLREELPISREFADKGWPPLLYPWFLAIVQFPEGDAPKRRAFMHHMGDCIRAGVLPAVRQSIPWFIEEEVIEPHISALDFSLWLVTEGKEPSPLVREWFTAHGVGRVPSAEPVKDRNNRWLKVQDEVLHLGRGAQASAVRRIVAEEGEKPATVKRGIQNAKKAREEARHEGGGLPASARKYGAHSPFGPTTARGRSTS